MKLAMVEWLDSYSLTGWTRRGHLQDLKPSRCVSAGMMVEEKDCVKFLQSISDDENMDNAMIIPRCAITRIRYLGIKHGACQS